jgi:hypothetical protein
VLVVGILFLLGGIWGLFKIELELVPISIIVAGLLLLISVFRGKKEYR